MSKFSVDEDLVRKLGALLKESGLNEIEYENAGQRIRVSAGQAMPIAALPIAAAPMAAPAAAPAPAPETAAHPAEDLLTSPMVGTAYLSPEPGGAPFVKIGDRVGKGQTVLIVEAMKVMNPIGAHKAGTVKDILIADAQPIEFGETLMVIG